MEGQAKIICAAKLPEGELAEIERKFDGLLGKPLTYTVTIDKSLVGGFKAIIDNTIYDFSVRSYLDRIEKYVDSSDSGLPKVPSLDEAVEAMKEEVDEAFRTTDVTKQIGTKVSQYNEPYDVMRFGRVERTGDGVVYVSGLDGCRYGEILAFEDGSSGIVMNLDIEHVGVVLLNGLATVQENSIVRHTGRVVSVPVGNELLGRVINAIGEPIDGRGPIGATEFRPVEEAAPPIMDRASIDTPLQTGILAIDSMIPIGRGQRELIIGDRQTGKSAIAVDTILNQRDTGVLCVYVAIGQKASSIAGVVDRLREFGALDYTVVVASTASDSAPMQYVAPYAGCSIAEHFMYQGKDVLIVYDDLSKHAVAYRTMSLLLRRPPGREAFPGDVFYLHSRLLERAAKLSEELGGGSMTALPLIETMDGDISSYIPTNVISITDGQIYLESELFNSGQRPAINVGLSVSRVGGSAQTKAMRQVAGPLRIDLAQYKELAVFSQFASDLDESTQRTLKNGERLMRTLVQPQFRPYDVGSEVILLYMATNGVLMDIDTKDVDRFDSGFLEFMDLQHPEVRADIMKTGQITDEQKDLILKTAAQYKQQFKASMGQSSSSDFSFNTGSSQHMLPSEAELVPVPEAGPIPDGIPDDND